RPGQVEASQERVDRERRLPGVSGDLEPPVQQSHPQGISQGGNAEDQDGRAGIKPADPPLSPSKLLLDKVLVARCGLLLGRHTHGSSTAPCSSVSVQNAQSFSFNYIGRPKLPYQT